MTSTVSELFHLSRSVGQCLQWRSIVVAFVSLVQVLTGLVLPVLIWLRIVERVFFLWAAVVFFWGFLLCPSFVFVFVSLWFLSWLAWWRLVVFVCLCPVGVHPVVVLTVPLPISLFVSSHLRIEFLNFVSISLIFADGLARYKVYQSRFISDCFSGYCYVAFSDYCIFSFWCVDCDCVGCVICDCPVRDYIP